MLNDELFQSGCASSTNIKDWESKAVCSCAGQYTKAFDKAVSAKDLVENPDWVKQPDAIEYSDLVALYKSEKNIDFLPG